jgi:SAM-dependent methyltransferase
MPLGTEITLRAPGLLNRALAKNMRNPVSTVYTRKDFRDAGDAGLIRVLEPQDIVVASDFLCDVAPLGAERCLHNIARIVKPGGHLFVSGIDLDVRAKVAGARGWRPVSQLIEEIHEGDPSVRGDWPFAWWDWSPLMLKETIGRCGIQPFFN